MENGKKLWHIFNGWIAISCASVALSYVYPLEACADTDRLSLSLDNLSQLRTVIGVRGLGVEVQATLGANKQSAAHFYWDDTSVEPDNNVSVLRPDHFDGAGRWRKAGPLPIDQTSYSHFDDIHAKYQSFSSTCPEARLREIVLTPSNSAKQVRTAFQEAAAKSGQTGCPIYVEPGVYPIDQDIVVVMDGVTVFCAKGAIFKKISTANAFWLKGAFDRVLGQCEIDGNNQAGSGLIIDVSAHDTEISGVYVHHQGGHGILNRGKRTLAEQNQTDDNQQIGFANDRGPGLVLKSLLSRRNGDEGLTIDNSGSAFVQVQGGYVEGNCIKGGVGNIGVDAATDVNISGIIAKDPAAACSWNLTAQNNVGNTERLDISGGYFAGAAAGDIHFRTNADTGFTVRGSSINGIVSASQVSILIDNGAVNNSILIDNGAVNNRIKIDNYSGGVIFNNSPNGVTWEKF